MRFPAAFLLTSFIGLGALPGISPEHEAFFEKEIRPLLAEHCFQCHSKEATRVKGGLLLDSAGGWQAGGDSGEVIVPGDPEMSPLIQAVRYNDADLQMPPKYRLKDKEIESLEAWVAMGAPDPRDATVERAVSEINIEAGRNYWAFKKPSSPHLPANIAGDSIDYLITEKHRAKEISKAPRADRLTLIRRVYFDLVGLPPSSSQIEAFVKDSRSDDEAFQAVVDDLLASKHFGERWGRHWLDVVRYAESMGRTRNFPFPYAWRYRDYVIDAFNADLPYDRFITEQVAGDLLPCEDEAERDHLRVATGFLAMGAMDLNERDREQYLMDVADEQIDVTTRAVLGLTTSCARCHDHKFDPILTTDYYALAGIFRSTETLSGYQNRQGGNRGGFNPELLVKLDTVPATVVAQESLVGNRQQAQRQVQALQRQLNTLNKQIQQRTKAKPVKRPKKKRNKREQKQEPITVEPVAVDKALENLKKRQKAIQRQLAKAKKNIKRAKNGEKLKRTANFTMGVSERQEPKDCQVNIRGDARSLGDSVPRGFLRVLCAEGEHLLDDHAKSGRLELAEWLTSPNNPLTARVFVNRVWHHLFGNGIVRTVDNFGAMGEKPTHPELLDHLARRFMEHDWSMKAIIRELVMSETYRMSSTFDEAANAVDPDNHLLWRMNVRRLEVEPMRDAILTVSGRLDLGRPEGSPVMRVSSGEMRRVPTLVAEADAQHRSVYVPVMRGHVPEFFQVFDFAEPSQVIGRRDVTTVSTQALYFMNSRFVMDEAMHAAKRLLKEVAEKDRLDTAYRWTLSRTPTSEERRRAQEFLTNAEIPDKLAERWQALFQALFASAEFRYIQ